MAIFVQIYDEIYVAEEWLQRMQRLGRNAKFVNDSHEFIKTSFYYIDHLLGELRSCSNLTFSVFWRISAYELEINGKHDEASVVNMTTAPIEIILRQPVGFLLFVEGVPPAYAAL
nr:hypothetical transcript [Hymenolepis microstoma]